MKLRMYHVIVAVFLHVHTCAHDIEAPPPLPSANPQIINNYRLALEAIFGIGIRLQTFLQDEENENFLVSPISATTVIAEMILGAEGEFRKQLVELLALPNSHLYKHDSLRYYNTKSSVTRFFPYITLHLQLSNLLKGLQKTRNPSKNFKLTQQSALFVDKNVHLNRSFEDNLISLYEAHVSKLDFTENPVDVQKKVNNWANKSTNGLIPTILSAPPSPNTAAIFANAIYFKAEWALPFSDSLNRKGLFNVSSTKQVPVTYMINQLDQIFYSESKDYRMIALPYTNEEVGMYILLPNIDSPFKYDIKGFVQNLKSREVLETMNKAKRRDVVIKLPKMSLSYSFSILEQLKKYRAFKKKPIIVNSTNVVDRLDDRVDAFNNFTVVDDGDIFLKNAALNHNLRIDDIVQQVVVTVNEKGTEAAAVTASTINYMGGSKNFLVDRPFIFFIRHEASGATLFWGTISNPAS